jgi:hypothetical protein
LTTEDTIIVPPLPAPLDPARYYTRAEYRAWKAAAAAHYDALAAVKRQKEELKRREATVHYLSDSEYDERGLAAFNAKKQKAMEQAAEDLRKQREREEWLASTPEIVQIAENNPCTFLRTLAHFLAKGCYEMGFDGPWHVSANQCWIQLHKKVDTPAKKNAHRSQLTPTTAVA